VVVSSGYKQYISDSSYIPGPTFSPGELELIVYNRSNAVISNVDVMAHPRRAEDLNKSVPGWQEEVQKFVRLAQARGVEEAEILVRDPQAFLETSIGPLDPTFKEGHAWDPLSRDLQPGSQRRFNFPFDFPASWYSVILYFTDMAGVEWEKDVRTNKLEKITTRYDRF
jgi:hypothetical protein